MKEKTLEKDEESAKQNNHYQIMLINEEGKQLAFKQNDKWTLNATTEEIIDLMLKSISKR